jgi:hypothetical protein
MRFIWFFGERSGISKSARAKRWSDAKNGYPTQHDKHFA